MVVQQLPSMNFLEYPCEQYTNISGPWRNRGFLPTPSQLQLKDDSDLQEGWYRFIGVGGDILDCPCLSIPSLAEERLGSCNSGPPDTCFITCHRMFSFLGVKKIDLCAGTDEKGSVDVKNCGGKGYFVHKLKPSNSSQIYTTRHFRCEDSEDSCGEFAQCGTLFGDCECKPGYEMPKGLLPTGDTYGCTDTDECALAGPCGVGVDCLNLPGSYHCDCVGGYLLHLFPNNTLTCTDQQEVETNCKAELSECIIDYLTGMINSSIEQNLPLSVVVPILVKLLASLYDLSKDTAVKTNTLIRHANSVLRSSEDVMAILMSPDAKTRSHLSITTSSAELQQITIGPDANPRPGVIQIKTDDSQLDINLSKNNADKASAALLVFTNMEEVITADFFTNISDAITTIMSKVVSVTLGPTTLLSNPLNLTLKHTNIVHPRGELSCVYWNGDAWVVDGCDVTQTNTTHTVCTCGHLSTFSLMMQVERNWLKMAAMLIGLLFLILTLVTFALCALNPKVTNLARLNLCISLFQAHLLSLLVQELILHILPHKVLCRVLSGFQIFFYLSGLLWMHLDILLLLLSIMMLKKLRKPHGEGPSCGHLSLIGYGFPLLIVGMVVGVMPDGYGTEWCGVRTHDGLSWSLLGPAYFTFTVNLIMLLIVFIRLCLLPSNESSLNEEIRNVRCQAARVLVQSVVITSPWVLGFFHMGYGSVLDILFIILNSQQGTFIFLIHCVFNPEVHSHWKRLFKKLASISTTPLNNM
ncbi:adhesion G protein-coupled receptor E2-like isoform X2 [Sardina pilchardus]|uniref:adhesion G protein-coupled receptor E2-like isoform X2 n=1 Tax=Sardina pilchardus TaxID=27697 RepID=UPI002E10959D